MHLNCEDGITQSIVIILAAMLIYLPNTKNNPNGAEKIIRNDATFDEMSFVRIHIRNDDADADDADDDDDDADDDDDDDDAGTSNRKSKTHTY
jgi:hypothetical protein